MKINKPKNKSKITLSHTKCAENNKINYNHNNCFITEII